MERARHQPCPLEARRKKGSAPNNPRQTARLNVVVFSRSQSRILSELMEDQLMQNQRSENRASKSLFCKILPINSLFSRFCALNNQPLASNSNQINILATEIITKRELSL
jgi:hypothetical protein